MHNRKGFTVQIQRFLDLERLISTDRYYRKILVIAPKHGKLLINHPLYNQISRILAIHHGLAQIRRLTVEYLPTFLVFILIMFSIYIQVDGRDCVR